MSKIILVTGATDGIGLATIEKLAALGHSVLVHGRSEEKLLAAERRIRALGAELVQTYLADFSDLRQVDAMAAAVRTNHRRIDVVINNAGVYKTVSPITRDNLDIRFAVNTLAPYVLTKALSPCLTSASRVINLSSAAQAAVDIESLTDGRHISDDFDAYAQSKTALMMWSRNMSDDITRDPSSDGPAILSVNPGSLLASKMVTEGFGVAGNDINIGANILVDLSLNPKYDGVTGEYFDNDKGDFSVPHADVLNDRKVATLVETIEALSSALIE